MVKGHQRTALATGFSSLASLATTFCMHCSLSLLDDMHMRVHVPQSREKRAHGHKHGGACATTVNTCSITTSSKLRLAAVPTCQQEIEATG